MASSVPFGVQVACVAVIERGRGRREGIREKKKCKISCERYWLFSRLIPFLILTGTKSPTQSTPALNTHGHEIKSSTSGGKVSSAQTRTSQEHSIGNNAPQRKIEYEEEESNSVERIALFAVTAILAGGLLLCILVLLFLFIWRRHLR